MTDPYKILEISPNATDDEVKEAYRKMAKKYHPDNYAGSPLADLANEKMKEVNEAYDKILEMRKQARNAGSGSSSKSTGGSTGYNYGYGYSAGNTGGYTGASSNFNDVRNMINNNRIADAEQILNGVSQDRRNAEWHFLKGVVAAKRGWRDDAYRYVSTAVQMDPNNMEYRQFFNQLNSMRSGNFGGYNPNMQTQQRGCTGCDVCSGLLCADCCCECFGGDCIRGC